MRALVALAFPAIAYVISRAWERALDWRLLRAAVRPVPDPLWRRVEAPAPVSPSPLHVDPGPTERPHRSLWRTPAEREMAAMGQAFSDTLRAAIGQPPSVPPPDDHPGRWRWRKGGWWERRP